MKIRNVAIVHFNTPELTEACILSLQKHGGEDYNVYLFDNSDERPFTKEMQGVTILDNTKGQIIDLDKEIEKYPERDAKYGCAKGCDFGSDKHMMSVQKLWELIPDGFLLLDSDVLIRRSVDFMFMEDECAAGHIGHCSGPGRIERFLPMGNAGVRKPHHRFRIHDVVSTQVKQTDTHEQEDKTLSLQRTHKNHRVWNGKVNTSLWRR